ncbi:MAG: hypothetical protein HY680_09950 [Chloroflexi bacterium]|nr:hypothetical protein [Chloroflexota bacterium]
MARAIKPHYNFPQASLRLRIQGLAEPEIASYVAALKKRYGRYAMPPDEARKVVDAAMGKKTLTELLFEARG